MTFDQQGLFQSEGLSVGASRVKTYLSRDGARVWQVLGQDFSSRLFDWLMNSNPGFWYSRTSPDFCRLSQDAIWEPSSGAFQNSGMASHGECLMLNSSEFHKDAVVCSLSDVLETTGEHLEKYLISARACAGILRRSEARGKPLPVRLRAILEAAASE